MTIPDLMYEVAAAPDDPWLRIRLAWAFLEDRQVENALGELVRARANPASARIADGLMRRIAGGPSEEVPRSRRVARVLGEARSVASALGESNVRTEHALLGILREASGTAYRVLVEQQVDEGSVSRAIGQVSAEPVRDRPRPPSTRLGLALEAAEAEARGLGHSEVRTEHLLLGLVSLRRSGACRALRATPESLQALRSRIEELLAGSRRPFAPDARAALAASHAAAARAGRNRIGTEHVLLGLLADPKSESARLFAQLEIDLRRARPVVARLTARAHPRIAGQRAAPLLRELLAQARDFAREARQAEVRGSDLARALLTLEDSVACRALRLAGVDRRALRQFVQVSAARADGGPATTAAWFRRAQLAKGAGPLCAAPNVASPPRARTNPPRPPARAAAFAPVPKRVQLDLRPRWQRWLTRLNWGLAGVLLWRSLVAFG